MGRSGQHRRALLRRLDESRTRAQKGVASIPAPATTEPVKVGLPLFGELDADRWSLPAFTLALAGLDAFNPCAFFVLLFLLSLLAHQKNRQRMALIGGMFVLDPIGMSGIRLEANVHIVTGGQTAINNTIKCVEKTGVKINNLVL